MWNPSVPNINLDLTSNERNANLRSSKLLKLEGEADWCTIFRGAKTLTFQNVRIAIDTELTALECALETLLQIVQPCIDVGEL